MTKIDQVMLESEIMVLHNEITRLENQIRTTNSQLWASKEDDNVTRKVIEKYRQYLGRDKK